MNTQQNQAKRGEKWSMASKVTTVHKASPLVVIVFVFVFHNGYINYTLNVPLNKPFQDSCL